MASIRLLALAALLALAPYQGNGSVVELTLRDAVTRQVVPAVQVTLTYKFPNEPPGLSHVLYTDDAGRVSFKDLPEGNYVLAIDRKGYVPLSLPDRVWIDSGQKQAFQISLNPMAVVAGKVLYQNGDPFPGAEISLWSVVYALDRPKTLMRVTGRGSLYAPTDDRGEFRLIAVPPGEYYLQIDTVPDRRQVGPDDLPRIIYYPGVTDLASATPLVVRGQDAYLAETRLPRPKTFKITGTLTNPVGNPPLPNNDVFPALFYFGSADPNALQDVVEVDHIASANPNESLFKIEGIVPGSYFLYSTFVALTGTLTNRTTVTVEDRDVEGLRIALKRNVAINARVRVTGDASTIRSETLRLSLVTKDRLPRIMRSGIGTMFVPDARTGEFVFSGLVEGVRYGIRVEGLPPDAYVADIRQGSRSPYSEGFFIAKASEGSVEIEIGTRGGTIQGVVRDALNQPVAQAGVTLVPDFAHRGNSLLYKRTTTNAEGQFGLRGIPPGEYQILAWTAAPPAGAEEDPTFIAPFLGRSTSIRISAGATTPSQLRVIP